MASKFLEGMSWDNHGEWHIDHIRPISSFPTNSPPSEVHALANLQPLWAKDNLKLDWDDKSHWQELASKHGYRLPVYYEAAKSKFVNRFLKHFNLSKEWYTDVTGFKSGNDEMRKNPNMPAFAQIGFLLEAYNEEIS